MRELVESPENLSSFQKITAGLNRFKRKAIIDETALLQYMQSNGVNPTYEQLDEIREITAGNPNKLNRILKSVGLEARSEDLMVKYVRPLTEEENEEWENKYIARTVSALNEAGSFNEEADRIATEFTSAYREGLDQTGLGILVGAEALWRGLFSGGTRTKEQLDYLSGSIAKSQAIADRVAELSGGDKIQYRIASLAGTLTPMLLTSIGGQALGIAGKVGSASTIGRAGLTAYGTTAAIGAVQPGTDMFSAEGVKTIIHAGVAVAAMRSGLTSAKITKGMPFMKAFMIDNAVNTGVDVATIITDLALEGELQYNPVDMMTTSFVSNNIFFGIGRVGGKIKQAQLDKMLTDDEYLKRKARGEAPEKTSQRLKLLTLDVLSEVDIENSKKIETLNKAIQSKILTSQDKAEIVNMYNRMSDVNAFGEYKSDLAKKFTDEQEEVKEKNRQKWNELTNASADDFAKLKDLEGGVEYAERLGEEIVGTDKQRRQETEVVSGEEEGLRIRDNEEIRVATEEVIRAETDVEPDKIKLDNGETLKDAVIRLAYTGKNGEEIRAELGRKGLDSEIEDIGRYVDTVVNKKNVVDEKALPRNIYSGELKPEQVKKAIREMTKNDANEIKRLRDEAERLGLPLGAASRGFTDVDPKRIKKQLIEFLKENISLKNRGKMIDAINKAETVEDLRSAIDRASRLEDAFRKSLAIAEYKNMQKKIIRARKSGKIIPDVWAKLQTIFDTFDPVKLSEEKRAKITEKAMEKIEEAFGKSVSDIYETLKNSPEVGGIFTSEDLRNIERLHKKPLSDLSTQEVVDIVDSLKKMYTASLEAYTVEWQGKRIAKEEFHNNILQEISKTKVNPLTKSIVNKKLFSMFAHNDMLAQMTGSKIIQKVFDEDIVAGTKKKYDIVYTAIDMFKNSDIPARFKDGLDGVMIDRYVDIRLGGAQLRITEDQLLKLYVVSKNANGLRHLIGGKENLIGGKESGIEYEGHFLKLSAEDISRVRSAVEHDEGLMSVVNVWRKISDYVYEEFNEVYRKQTGVDLPYEEYFTHLNVSDTFLPSEKTKEMHIPGQSAFQQVSGMPSTAKARKPSTAPIKLEGLLWSGQKSIEITAQYAGLAEPTKIAYGMLVDRSIANALKSTIGEVAYQRMVDGLKADMGFNYNPDEMNKIMTNILGNIAVGTLAFNVFSSIKTRTSLLAAIPYVEQKYRFAKIANAKEIESHSLLRLRAEGRISPEISMAMNKRFGTGRYGANMRKLMKTGMSFIANGDKWVVRKIYGMMKAKVDAEYPQLKGVEREQKIGELTYDVIRKSQPTFMTHDRPMARRSSGWLRAVFPFSSQRIQNFNVLLRALNEYTQSDHSIKAATRLTEAIILSWVIQSLLVAGIDEIRTELLSGGKRTSKQRMKSFFTGTANTFSGNIPMLDMPLEAITNKITGEYRYGTGYQNIVMETINSVVDTSISVIPDMINGTIGDMPDRKKEEFRKRALKKSSYLSRNIMKLLALPKVGLDYVKIVDNFTNKKTIEDNEEKLRKQLRKERRE